MFSPTRVLLVLLGALLASLLAQGLPQCAPDSLVLYHVTMQTHWNKENFPRHFPSFLAGYRPSAQFSRLVGRTHNSSFTLYRIGEMASEGLKRFAETSSSDSMDEMNSAGVFDAFNAPLIPGGEGSSSTQFFLDANHSKVSMVARIVPSPDWFCGVDSLDLCSNDQWVDSLTVDMDPIDAGTDNGYTFSAPNWATLPPEAIYHIHSAKLHPAHSFYREDRTEKPRPFATLTFLKLKEYSLAALRGSGNDGLLDPVPNHLLEEIEHHDVTYNELTDEQSTFRKRKRSKRMRGGRAPPPNQVQHNSQSRDCVVSHWSEWSECNTACGLGEQRRSRYIKNHPRGGTPCPPLSETRHCNSARECRDNYFDW